MKRPATKPKPTALQKAVELLAAQDHSTAKLKEKLVRRGYGTDEIDAAVARLTEKRYLDDEVVCRRQFQYMYEDGRLSLRQIMEKLRQRGFPREVIEACRPEDSQEREEAVALSCLRMKFRAPAPAEKWKVFLYRRGFDMAVCEAAAAAFRAEAPENAEEDDGFDE